MQVYRQIAVARMLLTVGDVIPPDPPKSGYREREREREREKMKEIAACLGQGGGET